MVTLKSLDGGEFHAHIAFPSSGRGPGIVVLQEIFGLNGFVIGPLIAAMFMVSWEIFTAARQTDPSG